MLQISTPIHTLLLGIRTLEDFMLPCFTKKIFDIDCPGCGIQRSLAFIVRGEFSAALQMYPAIFTLIALGGILITKSFIKIKHENLIINGLVAVNVLIILTNYIYKLISN